MVAVALVLRLTVMMFVYPERLNPDREYWRFGGETGRIARSLVQGHGYSSPLHANTGPTAWMPPVYPGLLAGVFRVFGVYTKPSALVILSLGCLFSALACIPIFLIARKKFGDRAAVWAGWLWVFFPYAIFFSADFIWPTSLTTLCVPLIFLAALQFEESPTVQSGAWYGALAAVSALNDPIVLSIAVPLGLWMTWRLLVQRQRWLAPALSATLAFVIVVSPWFIRNYEVFHVLIPFRDNAGLELYTGNTGETWHFAPSGYHPSDTPREWAEFQQLGELPYMAHKRQQAIAHIRAHPGEFVVLSIRRVIYMWTNYWSFSSRYLAEEPADPFNIVLCTSLTVLALIGIWRAFHVDMAIAMPFVVALFCYPIVYYFTHVQDYFHRPIDPIYIVLAGYVIANFRPKSRSAEAAEVAAQ